MRKHLKICRICSLEAWTEEDLDKFVKDKHKPYGRRRICKKCHNEGKTKPKPNYLRKCAICGLEAHTLEELELFEKNPKKPYGRGYRCNACNHQRYYTTRLFRKRQRELIEDFPKPLTCSFCGKLIIKLSGQGRESLAIHSLDGNHENWNPKNKTPMHVGCHTTFHSTGRKASLETKIKMSKSHKRRFSNEVSIEDRQKAIEQMRNAGRISHIKKKD